MPIPFEIIIFALVLLAMIVALLLTKPAETPAGKGDTADQAKKQSGNEVRPSYHDRVAEGERGPNGAYPRKAATTSFQYADGAPIRISGNIILPEDKKKILQQDIKKLEAELALLQ